VNAHQKTYLTEQEVLYLTRCIKFAATVFIFCVPILIACGTSNFFRTASNVLLKGQGMQFVIIWCMVFFDYFYISVAVVFVLWRQGRFREFKPFKHPLGRTTLKKIEYLQEEDKIKYGRLISFVFLPASISAVTLGWFLMARNHCP
jgi:hypothetical protein